MEKSRRKLVLENGEIFVGDGFGADVDAIGEIVFNTSMSGYQEIVSDPSYFGQLIVMTYPLIGNYGITDEDYESKNIALKALVVREYNDSPSNFRYTKTLAELLEENNVPGLQGIDTRKLVRIIRKNGSMLAMLVDEAYPTECALNAMKEYTAPTDSAKKAGCKKKWYSRTPNHQYDIVAIDCGIKFQMVKNLNMQGCNVTMVPWDITAQEVLNLHPDGLFISNGPGSPQNMPEVVALVKALKGKLPMMGVCMGTTIIGEAYGTKTIKMKVGHRGTNHPVEDLTTGNIEIVVQNHSFVVDELSIVGTGLEITHRNLLDQTIEGIEDKKNFVFGVQFHPEVVACPNNSTKQFEKFILNIEEWKKLCQSEQI